MIRTQVLNSLIRAMVYKSYLEIGVNNPNDNYNYIMIESKECVDPYDSESFENVNLPDRSDKNTSFLTYRMTSDEFFSKVNKSYDIIFIDGLHTEEQSTKDLINAFKHLNPNGLIVMHDSFPLHEEYQNETPISKDIPWLGQVWKTIVKLGRSRCRTDFHTIAREPGLTIIRGFGEVPLDIDYKLDMNFRDLMNSESDLLHAIDEFNFIRLYL